MNETTSTPARAESKKGIYFRFKNKTYYNFTIVCTFLRVKLSLKLQETCYNLIKLMCKNKVPNVITVTPFD